MENTGDRTVEMKENDEVDRFGITAEPDEVDREISSYEDFYEPFEDESENKPSAITFYIHPVPPDKSKLLKGFEKTNILCYLVGQHHVFGRGADVDVFLNDDKASRRHMELTAMIAPNSSGQQLFFKIKNVSKAFPLHVNNESLNPGGERFLMRSDVIRIGQLTFTVDINPNHAYSGTEMYNLEFQMLPALQHTSEIPPQPAGLPQTAGLSYNPFGVPQQGMPQGFIPGPHIPHTSFQPPLGTVPHMPNMQTSPGFTIFPTSFHPIPQQGQFPLNDATQNIHNYPAQFIPGAVNSGGQQQVQDRREMFQQNIAGHIPSENDDVHNGPKKSLSVEETQPPKHQSSFEETQPPKQM